MTTAHIDSLVSETGSIELAMQPNNSGNLEVLANKDLGLKISSKESRDLNILAGIGIFSAYAGTIMGATSGYLSSENPFYAYPLALTGGIVGPAITTLILIGGIYIKDNIARILK